MEYDLHEKIQSNARKSNCIIDGWGDCSKHTVQGGNAESCEVNKQYIDKVLTSIDIKSSHEVLWSSVPTLHKHIW